MVRLTIANCEMVQGVKQVLDPPPPLLTPLDDLIIKSRAIKVMMADWMALVEKSMEEHKDLWERLAHGHTAEDLDIAYVLRSIVADIEGPHMPNWSDVLYALSYIRCILEKRAGIPPQITIPSIWTDDEQVGSDSTTTTTATDMEWTVLYAA